VSLHLHRSSLLNAANNPLAHLSKNAINNPNSAGNHVTLSEVATG
jgi:hypothetical protein